MSSYQTGKVKAEIAKNGRRIELSFDDDGHGWVAEKQFIAGVKNGVPGASFSKTDLKWRVPLDVTTIDILKDLFGENLKLKKFVKAWYNEQIEHREKFRSIGQSTTAKLKVLPKVLPDLYEAIHLGPIGKSMNSAQRKKALKQPPSYQAADVAFMAMREHPINANHPGTGKTIETIASIFEAKLDDGPNLIIAPLSSLGTTWKPELVLWQPHEVMVGATGGRATREEVLEDARTMYYDGLPFWLLINPEMAALRSEFRVCHSHRRGRHKVAEKRSCEDCEELFVPQYEIIHDIEWNTVVMDEFHKMGLGNTNTMTVRGLAKIQAQKKIALSGTPMGGRITRLWAILHLLYPDEFSSKWRFAEQWLSVEEGGYGGKNIIEEVRQDVEDDFYDMLSAYMVRRTKEEVLPWLPPKQYVPLWVDMTDKQAAQYNEFARLAEIRIEEEMLTATSILAEYTRLRQFAFSAQTLETYTDPETGDQKVRPHPTQESCKLPAVMDILDELGIKDNNTDEQCVIFSQFTQIVDLVTDWLREHGIAAEKITGAIKEEERVRIVQEFQKPGGCKVLVMNVKAGGVSITLDRASTAIMLDETWNPDDQEQAEDRIHRGSRIHQVTIYYIRTRDTIEEYVKTVVEGKVGTNFNILDARRKGLRATGNEWELK